MANDPAFAQVISKYRSGDEVAAREVFGRFVHRLVALASKQFDQRVRSKEDPEDVVNSAYKSFFRRDVRAPFDLSDWDGLWALLATITVRKCIDRREFWRAECRDVGREDGAGFEPTAQSWEEAVDREPTPDQALALAETLERLFVRLGPDRREVAELSLQGYTAPEIVDRCGCSERTVGRVLARVRVILEEMEAEAGLVD